MGGGGFRAASNPALQKAEAERKRLAAEAAAKKQQDEADAFKLRQDDAGTRGIRLYEQNKWEKQAGLQAPELEGARDLKTGELLSRFKLDPYSGEATQALKAQAFAEGDSPWAKLQLAKQQQEQMAGMDAASKAGLQGMSQAQAQLASSGGLSTGARERMARGGSRDLMAARQAVGRQGIGSRLGIQSEDLDRKQGLLSDFATSESAANKFNIGQLQGDIERKAAFEGRRYDKGMEAYGAEQTANAQRAAAPKKKKGCCFIFLEARYGNGVMDKVVRRYRDENMTDENRRGYYKLAEVLVPLMRKYSLVKFLVRVLMTDPMVSYGKWYYGEGKIGFLFAPVKSFWLGVFTLLGGHTEFVRETGEVV